MRDWKTDRNVSQPLVVSLKYENKVTVKKFPFMKVQNNSKLSSILVAISLVARWQDTVFSFIRYIKETYKHPLPSLYADPNKSYDDN